MKMRNLLLVILVLSFAGLVAAFRSMGTTQQALRGAWVAESDTVTRVLLITDDYLSLAVYGKGGRRFIYTLGGPVLQEKGKLRISCEYHSLTPEQVGHTISISYKADRGNLQTAAAITGGAVPAGSSGGVLDWTRLDDGNAPLAGNWHITQRMQDGNLQRIHQSGTRKTIKLLTGSHFQWVAIDPGVKGFYGTGGGTYTFTNGKYTEHIGFFSRDSSRVGASLSFNGKLEQGNWHHSGKSSRGDDIYEVWSRGE